MNVKTALGCAALLLITSCTKRFEEINTNPNAPITASPELLLRQVEYNFGENHSYEGFTAGNTLGQYFTMVDFNLWDRHDLRSPQYGGKPWTYIYTNLRDNENLLAAARSNSVYKVYEGPALILKAYMTGILTDLYGDVPYFTALQGKAGITAPAYDRQEDIYNAPGGILDNLEKGLESIKAYNGPQALRGDIVYGGKLASWQKFANSLRIKYLLRASAKMDVRARLQAIYNEANFINSPAENAVFSFTDGAPNAFRFATLRVGDFNLFVMSQTIFEVLTGLNDPRIATFFRSPSAAPGTYKGLLNGQDASKTSITVANYSLAGIMFREQTSRVKANFMTDWETKFLLAEAALRGYITADDRTLYDAGVQSAIAYWGAAIAPGYLTTGAAAYGASGKDKLEQIITQKWIAGMLNGYEGWTEWRRTGFPQLKPVAASLNDGKIPVRLPYPSEEQALNAANYNAAAAATGGNSINYKVWWQVN